MGEQQVTAVPTKVRPVRLPASAIERRALLALSEGILDHRITVVTAPAGFGKTWLVADWLSYHPELAVGWLSLDRYDNDPVRLATHLVESVATVYPDVAGATLEVMSNPLNGLVRAIDAMSAAFAEGSDPCILVIDDIQALSAGGSSDLLAQVVAQMPERVHIVLIGRSDPSFSISRYRVSGDLLEIRTAHLRCTDAEATDLITRVYGHETTDSVATELNRRAMGWIGGIRLAAGAASFRGTEASISDVPAVGSFDGAYDAVGHYLVEEVLDHLDGAERQFLLDTSILDVMPTELCDHLTGRADSAAILHQLEQSGLFTSASNDVGTEYAYHDILKMSMRAVLWRQQPKRAADLCGVAARWMHGHGNTLEAVSLAAQGGVADEVDVWITEALPELLGAGQASTLYDMISELNSLSSDLSILMRTAWCMAAVYLDKPESELDHVLDYAIDGLVEARDSSVDDAWIGETGPLGMTSAQFLDEAIAMSAYRRGDLARVVELVKGMAGVPGKNGFVESVFGALLSADEQYTMGMQQLERWYEWIFSPDSKTPANRADGITKRANLEFGRGQLSEVEALTFSSRDELMSSGFGSTTQFGMVTVPAARVAWERGELQDVFELLDPVMDRIDTSAYVPAFVEAHLVRARASWSLGDMASVRKELDRARITPAGRHVKGVYHDRILEESSRFHLLEGDVDKAAELIGQFEDVGGPSIRHALLKAWLVAQLGQDPRTLLEALPDNREVTVVHRMDGFLVEARWLLTVGEQEDAITALAAAMRLASETGHIQRFLDERSRFGATFDNAVAISGHLIAPASAATPPPPGVREFTLLEPLTQSELTLLRLLPSHMTYAELAEELMISRNTVKSHLKIIYRKLGAGKRSEAVAAARFLHLVD